MRSLVLHSLNFALIGGTNSIATPFFDMEREGELGQEGRKRRGSDEASLASNHHKRTVPF